MKTTEMLMKERNVNSRAREICSIWINCEPDTHQEDLENLELVIKRLLELRDEYCGDKSLTDLIDKELIDMRKYLSRYPKYKVKTMSIEQLADSYIKITKLIEEYPEANYSWWMDKNEELRYLRKELHERDIVTHKQILEVLENK